MPWERTGFCYVPFNARERCHVFHVFDENDEVDDKLINLLVVVVWLLEF